MRLFLSLLGSLLLAASASGQGARGLVVPGAEVAASAPGPDTLSTAAGGTIGFGVRLQERGGVGHALRLDMRAPEGWRPLLTQPSFHLGAGASSLQIVSLRVPSDAQAGLYPVAVRIRGAEGWETSLKKIIHVEARMGVSVAIVGAPRFVVAGEGYTATALVRNGGNVPATVAVGVRSSLGSDVDPEEAEVAIEPNGTAEVALTIGTARRARAATDRLRVTAVLLSDLASMDGAVASVEVVPRGTAIDRSVGWPLMGSVSAVSRGADVTPLLGLSGEIQLPDDRGATLTFEVGGMGPASSSLFARQPEAWARYVDPSGELLVGTGTYVLSPVTSAATYGIGAGGRAQLGRVDVSGVLRRPWPIALATEPGMDAGVGVGLAVGHWGRVSLNALAAGGPRGGEVATARFELLGLSRTQLEAEVGLASGEAPRPVYGLRGSARLGTLVVSGAATQSDAEQPGRLTSRRAQSVSGLLGVGAGISGWASWRASQQDQSRVSVFSPSSERSTQGGFRWAGGVGGLEVRAEAGGEHRWAERSGIAGQLTLGEAGLDVAWRGLRASVDAGAGRVRVSEGVLRPAWTAAGALGLRTRALDASLSTSIMDGASLWSPLPTRQWSTTADLSARLGQVGLRGSLTTGRFEADVEGIGETLRASTLLGRLEATTNLGLGRELVLAGSHYAGSGAEATHLQATLRVPVPVALPGTAVRPELHGRFVDAATGEGVPGVLVYHGEDRVVTDGDGAFAFATTPVGGYLFLDRATLGADRVPLDAFPLLATPGTRVEVRVVRRVTLRGALRQMTLLGTGALADTADVGGLGLAVVEAEGMGQRHRAVTDAEGRFAFGDLPAGAYVLRLIRGVLPDRHRLERETIALEVDGDVEVLWRVVPDRRELQLLGGARLGGDGSVRVAEAAPVRLTAPPAPAPRSSSPPASKPLAEADPAPRDTLTAGRVRLRAPLARVEGPDRVVVRPDALATPRALPEASPVLSAESAAAHDRLLLAQTERLLTVTRAPGAAPGLPAERPTVYRAEIGDHLLAIARRFALTEAEILQLNPGLGDHLVVGQPVRLRPDPVRPTVHLARPGEHLLSIGRAYGLTETEVRALNPGLGDHLVVGQPVRVAGAPSRPATHRVEPGEYLLSIARRYGLTEDAIRGLNPRVGDHLEVGQVIRLRAGSEAPTPAERRHSPGGRW